MFKRYIIIYNEHSTRNIFKLWNKANGVENNNFESYIIHLPQQTK